MTTLSHSVIARWFFLLLATAILFLYWQIISPYVIVLATAAVAAVIVAPVEARIRKVVKNPKLSGVIMLLFILVAIIGPLVAVGAVMVSQANDIASQTLADPEWRANFDYTQLAVFQYLPEPLRTQALAQNPESILDVGLSWIQHNIGAIFSGSAALVFKIGIFFICLFFFLVDREKIYKAALELSPLKDAVDRSIMTRLVETVRGVVFGALIVAIIQATLAAVGLTIFGVPGALLWASLIMITAQVPVLGNTIIMGPAVIYLFATGHTGAAIGLMIWSLTAVGLVDNMLSPIIVGGRTGMHTLLILISILGGLEFFGPIGLILGPTVLAAVLVILELYKAGILENGATT